MAPRIVILDLESSSLEADAGIVVGAGLMTEAGRAEYLEARKSGEEKRLVSRLLGRLEGYDLIVTWSGNGFDVPFLTTRLLKHGLDPRPFLAKRRLDLNLVVKSNLRLTFTYLDHVCEFFGIKRENSLMGMDVPLLFLKAMEGDRSALKRIKMHCLDDLRATRLVFLRLKPLLGYWLVDSEGSFQSDKHV